METHSIQNPALKDYLQHYFVLDFGKFPNLPNEIKIPPLGFPVIQFHFGEDANFYRHKHFTSQSIIIGQCSRHILLYPSNKIKIFGINFKPYGLYNLLGVSPKYIKDSCIESSLIFGKENIEAISLMLKTGSIEMAIGEIENLLLKYQNLKQKKHKHFDNIVDVIVKENGLINCSKLVGNKVSIRTFQRYFSEVIGISPKLFSQVLRHKYIMTLLYNNPEMTWSNMQLNGFYYDYAHFAKDITLFSGLTPRQYLPIKNCIASALIQKRE